MSMLPVRTQMAPSSAAVIMASPETDLTAQVSGFLGRQKNAILAHSAQVNPPPAVYFEEYKHQLKIM